VLSFWEKYCELTAKGIVLNNASNIRSTSVSRRNGILTYRISCSPVSFVLVVFAQHVFQGLPEFWTRQIAAEYLPLYNP
jgi:hypothetical protein